MVIDMGLFSFFYILLYLQKRYQFLPAPLVKYAFFFPFDIFCFFIKGQVFEDVWIDIWVFYSVPLVLLSVLMPIPGCFPYCSSVEFEVRDCDASRSSFIVQDCFDYSGFFAFPYEVEYRSFEVFEEFCPDFDGLFFAFMHEQPVA